MRCASCARHLNILQLIRCSSLQKTRNKWTHFFNYTRSVDEVDALCSEKYFRIVYRISRESCICLHLKRVTVWPISVFANWKWLKYEFSNGSWLPIGQSDNVATEYFKKSTPRRQLHALVPLILAHKHHGLAQSNRISADSRADIATKHDKGPSASTNTPYLNASA